MIINPDSKNSDIDNVEPAGAFAPQAPQGHGDAQNTLFAPPNGPPPTYAMSTANSVSGYNSSNPRDNGSEKSPGLYSTDSATEKADHYRPSQPPNQPVERSLPYSAAPGPSGSSAAAYQPPFHPHNPNYPESSYLGSPSAPPDTSPSPTLSSSSSKGIMDTLKGHFTPPRDPLNPPPPSFSRAPPPNYPYMPFPPMSLHANAEFLADGFPVEPPLAQVQPHPFVGHDITEVDWTRFLEDLKIVGGLQGKERMKAGVVPMVTGVGFIGGMLMTKGLEKKMKNKKTAPVSELINIWNTNFFGPRRMQIVLARGMTVYNGPSEQPPDWQSLPPDVQNRRRRSDSSSSSPSSSSSSSDSSDSSDSERKDRTRDTRRSDRKEARRARREERREARTRRRAERRVARETQKAEKRAKREEKRSRKNGEHFRLVVAPL